MTEIPEDVMKWDKRLEFPTDAGRIYGRTHAWDRLLVAEPGLPGRTLNQMAARCGIPTRRATTPGNP